MRAHRPWPSAIWDGPAWCVGQDASHVSPRSQFPRHPVAAIRTKILIAVGFLLVVFVVIVALQPEEFRVERSARVAAPPAAVFAQVLRDGTLSGAYLSPCRNVSAASAQVGSGRVVASAVSP